MTTLLAVMFWAPLLPVGLYYIDVRDVPAHMGVHVSIRVPEVNHSTASYSGRTRHSRNAMFRVLGLEVFSRIPLF